MCHSRLACFSGHYKPVRNLVFHRFLFGHSQQLFIQSTTTHISWRLNNSLIISLNPSSFESLQLYFTKFKALVLQLKQCGIENKEEQLVLTILSNIDHDYSVFVSTFYATKLIAQTWKMPKLVEFMKSLTQEQDKLVMMGTIKTSKE